VPFLLFLAVYKEFQTLSISIISVIALASEGSFTGDKPNNDLALLRSLREI